MKKVIAIDAGVTTGFAVFKLGEDEPIEYGDIPFDKLNNKLTHLKLIHLVSYSVCERPVIIRGKLGTQLESVVSTIRMVFDHQIQFVDPAQWKQTPLAKTPCPRGISPHARDSIRLGRWYMRTLKDRLQQD